MENGVHRTISVLKRGLSLARQPAVFGVYWSEKGEVAEWVNSANSLSDEATNEGISSLGPVWHLRSNALMLARKFAKEIATFSGLSWDEAAFINDFANQRPFFHTVSRCCTTFDFYSCRLEKRIVQLASLAEVAVPKILVLYPGSGVTTRWLQDYLFKGKKGEMHIGCPPHRFSVDSKFFRQNLMDRSFTLDLKGVGSTLAEIMKSRPDADEKYDLIYIEQCTNVRGCYALNMNVGMLLSMWRMLKPSGFLILEDFAASGNLINQFLWLHKPRLDVKAFLDSLSEQALVVFSHDDLILQKLL